MIATDAPMTPRERLAGATVGVVAAWAALWRLGTPQVLPDEVVYLRAGASILAGEGDPNPEHPPLAKWLFGLAGRAVGDPLWGGRLVAAVASVAIAALLFLLVRRMVGARGGLVAAGLWAVLPHAGGRMGPLGAAGRLDRFAMLDPVATALSLGALLAAWSWLSRPRWQAAATVGVLGGLAAGAKPTGVLVLPAVALVVLWCRRGEVRSAVAEVGLAAVASLLGLGLAYLPLGRDAPDALRRLVEFQTQHAADGHVVTVAGTTTAHPPWWSHLWFHLRDDGLVLSALLAAGVGAALWVARRDDAGSPRARGVALVATTLAVAFAALAASPVKLPFYRYAWLPLLVALLAVALHAAAEHRREVGHLDATWFAANLVIVGLVATSVPHLASLATLRPGGYQLVASELVDMAGSVGGGAGPILLLGRAGVLDFHLQQHGDVGLLRVDHLDDAAAVLLDPEITSRFPRPEVEAVVGDPAWACEGFDELLLCVRREPLRSPA